LEAESGSSAAEKEICPSILARAKNGALLKNMAAFQIGEGDAVLRVVALPEDPEGYGLR